MRDYLILYKDGTYKWVNSINIIELMADDNVIEYYYMANHASMK